ncbi:trypsin-like peptidase domain-containing protein [Candidatus Nitrospira allomarina]|uniref:Trypsin-like peptidase domain-containing protein n=1 Tax=Candidatus Nitrospira allomarina TaxID=3020900 RepID=A0AA96GGB3_9BACT|nr:trypsin-like peptidase domain-containing protein [Candidatus Nitrospira allomarina]WNM57191.1 trypsin-like peptidase domain-containing protein [Candidatus Nitrospira allomarina]
MNFVYFSPIFSLCCLLLCISPSAAVSQTAKELRGLELLEDIEQAITSLAERVTPTVVNITPIREIAQGQGFQRRAPFSQGSGSGVIVREDGIIVTNNHVVGEDAREADVRLSDKSNMVARVIGRDKETDIAVLKIESDRKFPVAHFGDSDALKVGQWVLAVGNPMGLDRTVTLGVISGIGRERLNLSRYENFIQTDAAINPGNSGGPLFNLRGEVIGINTAIIHMAQGIGFSIPADMVSRVVDQLVSRGRVVRGWLGVGIQSLTKELAEQFGIKEGHGVLVNEVYEHDPAHVAGIKPGDIIVAVDDSSVDSPNQLSRLVARVGPGENAKILVLRDGKELTYLVPIVERQEKSTLASLPLEKSEVSLGLDVQGLTAALAEQFELEETVGVLVTKVEPGGLANSEGIQEGDLINEVNRKTVRTVTQFSEEVAKVKPGQTILLRIIRKTRAFFIVIKTLP